MFFLGGSSGGPAKHCAIDNHCFATLPVSLRSVSSTFLVCVTTLTKSVAVPSIREVSEGVFHSHDLPDGLSNFTKGTLRGIGSLRF